MGSFSTQLRSWRFGLPGWLVPVAVVILAALLASRSSLRLVLALLAAAGGLLLLRRPVLGLPLLVAVALVGPIEISTGTEVALNPTSLFIPLLLGIWGLSLLMGGRLHLVPARANRPLALFLLAGLVSLAIGNVTWDPAVPKSGHFLLVQFAQWGIFALSAGAFWLAANLIKEERWLQRLTIAFLLIGGVLALLIAWLGTGIVVNRISTAATFRAPFWILLFGVAGGQMLFNSRLGHGWRLFLLAVIGAALLHAFGPHDERASDWVGLTIVTGVLLWLRFPRLGWLASTVVLSLLATGLLLPTLYEFAGGDARWEQSGGSRLALIQRTVEVTLRNPVTGLGPASYRPYTTIKPLLYRQIYWTSPRISSHNNYVDIFAHTGLIGLGLFLWFMAEVCWLAWRLHKKPHSPFARGFIAAMLATWFSIMGVMLLLDWFLPFVYNVSFRGFQASVLVWLFLGGLVALTNFGEEKQRTQGNEPRAITATHETFDRR